MGGAAERDGFWAAERGKIAGGLDFLRDFWGLCNKYGIGCVAVKKRQGLKVHIQRTIV